MAAEYPTFSLSHAHALFRNTPVVPQRGEERKTRRERMVVISGERANPSAFGTVVQ